MNYGRTAMLLAAMTGLFLAVGIMIGGEAGMVFALAIGCAMNLFAYRKSDKMMLRLFGAQQVDEKTAPQLYRLMAQLAKRVELPMPKLFIIENNQPNAFATGRKPEKASVVATTGLIRNLNQDEIAGAMAHELAHAKNRDTLIMTITATVAGALSMLANFALFFGGNRDSTLGFAGVLLIAILAPMGAMVVQMAISRAREYEADRIGADICGHPLWLASALGKLEKGADVLDNGAAERNPATAHLFIINPLHAHAAGKLFSTHPKTANRIQRLREMTGAAGPWD